MILTSIGNPTLASLLCPDSIVNLCCSALSVSNKTAKQWCLKICGRASLDVACLFWSQKFSSTLLYILYRCHAVCLLIDIHSFSLSLFFSLLYTFFEDVLSLNWWEISGREQRFSGAAWKAVEELALWVSETQGERRHKQTPAMQSTTIPPNQPAHLIAYSTHMPMSCSKNEKERFTCNTWPVTNITHLFRSTNSFCSQMFPQAVWEYLLYFKPSLKNMTGQMGFAIIEFKVSPVNLHTSVSHGLQRRDRLKWPH